MTTVIGVVCVVNLEHFPLGSAQTACFHGGEALLNETHDYVEFVEEDAVTSQKKNSF